MVRSEMYCGQNMHVLESEIEKKRRRTWVTPPPIFPERRSHPAHVGGLAPNPAFSAGIVTALSRKY
jgi:hypothetical protein